VRLSSSIGTTPGELWRASREKETMGWGVGRRAVRSWSRRKDSRAANFCAGVGRLRRWSRRECEEAGQRSSREVSRLVKRVGAVGDEGEGSAGVEGDADELGEVDGVDVLVDGVEAEEDGGWSGRERVGGVVSVGEVVAGE
jgi:hypothetical protein